MPVQRISNINIKQKGIFTALYGEPVSGDPDIFIDKNLKLITFEAALYLYLKDEGYKMVIFYNYLYGFYSYSSRDVVIFLNPSKEDYPKEDEIGYLLSLIDTPLRSYRFSSEQNNNVDNSHNGAIKEDNRISSGREHLIYYTAAGKHDILEYLQRILSSNDKKSAFVFFANRKITPFENKNSEELIESYLSRLHENNYLNENKIIIVYPFGSSSCFYDEWKSKEGFFYKDMLKNVFIKKGKLRDNTTFKIKDPCVDEVTNIVNRKRLLENVGIECFHPFEFKKIVQTIYKNKMQEIVKIDIESVIKDLHNDKIGSKKLDGLIGLDDLKKNIKELESLDKITNYRLNFAFLGNPGTGKTTVARLLGETLCSIGLIDFPEVIECRQADIVGQYVGSTALKVQDVFDRAIGKVLFIDEAYAICRDQDGKSSFGQEAIDAITGNLSDKKYMNKMAVVFAGYTEATNIFFDMNEGLRSRIYKDNSIEFPDYEVGQLLEIFDNLIKKDESKFVLEEGSLELAKKWFANRKKQDKENFANGRCCEYLFSRVTAKYTTRLREHTDQKKGLIKCVDFPNYNTIDVESYIDQFNSLVGLQKIKEVINELSENANIYTHIGVPLCFNLTFMFRGNSGTGKTFVAEKLGEILNEIGVLTTDHVVKWCKHAGVNENFNSALGKVLFIDNIYDVFTDNNAINTIIENLNHERYLGKIAIVMTGSNNRIDEFIEKNPKIEKAFKYRVNFKDYTNEELCKIFYDYTDCQGFVIDNDLESKFVDYFASLKRDENFENASLAKLKLFDRVSSSALMRIRSQNSEGMNKIDNKIIMTVTEADVPPINC